MSQIARRWPWPALLALPAFLAALALTPSAARAHDDEDDDFRGQRWVLIEGDDASMSGSTDDLRHAKRLAREQGAPLLWFRQDGREYVIRDAALLKEVHALFEPQRELGKKMSALGEQQSELGEKQSELGEQQAALGAEMAKLAHDKARKALARMKARHDRRRDDDADDADENDARADRDEVSARMERIGEQMSELGEKQGALGEEQSKLGARQSKMGHEMSRLARKAMAGLQELFARAIREGKAREQRG